MDVPRLVSSFLRFRNDLRFRSLGRASGAGFGRKLSASGPETGPKLPGSKAQAVWDCFLVCSH